MNRPLTIAEYLQYLHHALVDGKDNTEELSNLFDKYANQLVYLETCLRLEYQPDKTED